MVVLKFYNNAEQGYNRLGMRLRAPECALSTLKNLIELHETAIKLWF